MATNNTSITVLPTNQSGQSTTQANGTTNPKHTSRRVVHVATSSAGLSGPRVMKTQPGPMIATHVSHQTVLRSKPQPINAKIVDPYDEAVMGQTQYVRMPARYMNATLLSSRNSDKNKGLRHFSTKVCEKVKEKARTTYNEVADELVREYFSSLTPQDQEKQSYDMRNIRRRVYDALNVLLAMNIIEKEKKEIRWVGLPTSSAQECEKLEIEKIKRQERIRQKSQQLHLHLMQLVMYQSLVSRNRDNERSHGRPPANTLLYLPFILVNTHKTTTIECSVSNDKTEYLFNFDQPFEIHDEVEMLRRLNLCHGLESPTTMTKEQIATVKSMLPESMHIYVDQLVDGTMECYMPNIDQTANESSVEAIQLKRIESNLPSVKESIAPFEVMSSSARYSPQNQSASNRSYVVGQTPNQDVYEQVQYEDEQGNPVDQDGNPIDTSMAEQTTVYMIVDEHGNEIGQMTEEEVIEHQRQQAADTFA